MNKRIIFTASIAALMAAMTACTSDYQKDFENSAYDYGSRTELHEQYRSMSYSAQTADHDNKSLQLDKAAGDAVDRMPGIRSSLVFVTDKNVYVALVLDDTATGTKGRGKMLRSDRTIASRGIDDYSDASYKLPPGHALMERYSYNTVPDPNGLSSELRNEVTAVIRQHYPEVTNVFISANRDYVNRLIQLAHEVWQGKPLDPYLEEFNTMAKGHFGNQGAVMIQP